MARPRSEFPPVAAVRSLIDPQGRLALRVTPGARQESIAIGDGRLDVKVRAKAQDGAANAAVRSLVAAALGLAPSRVTLLRGATGRDKVLQIAI